MQFSTFWATFVSGVDRVKLNEAIHADHYRCAPKTDEAVSRVFDETHMIGLMTFGRLTRFGFSKRVAADLACKAQDAFTNQGDSLRRLMVCIGADGSQSIIPEEVDAEKRNLPHFDLDHEDFSVALFINILAIRRKLKKSHARLIADGFDPLSQKISSPGRAYIVEED